MTWNWAENPLHMCMNRIEAVQLRVSPQVEAFKQINFFSWVLPPPCMFVINVPVFGLKWWTRHKIRESNEKNVGVRGNCTAFCNKVVFEVRHDIKDCRCRGDSRGKRWQKSVLVSCLQVFESTRRYGFHLAANWRSSSITLLEITIIHHSSL